MISVIVRVPRRTSEEELKDVLETADLLGSPLKRLFIGPSGTTYYQANVLEQLQAETLIQKMMQKTCVSGAYVKPLDESPTSSAPL